MRFGTMLMASAAALVIGLSGSATAQTGKACQLTGSATLETGKVDADTTPESGYFFFKGTLSNCQGSAIPSGSTVCSYGRVDNASCAENVTTGTKYVICAGQCNVTATTAACATGTPIKQGVFSGVCIGANCSGATTPAGGANGIAYSLLFDQATVERALTDCSTPNGLTAASFSGGLVYGQVP
jgi:hypothetical protein